MPDTVTLRVTIEGPVPGVALAVQRGRDAFVAPVRAGAEAVTFQVSAEVRERSDGTLVLAGAEVQGPPAARFLYIAVGTRAGQPASPWERRARCRSPASRSTCSPLPARNQAWCSPPGSLAEPETGGPPARRSRCLAAGGNFNRTDD